MSLVKFIKGTQAEIDATPIVDGQVLFQTDAGDDGKIYHDDGDVRYVVGGKTDVYDGLDSDSATKALSAKQGKALSASVRNNYSTIWEVINDLLSQGLLNDGAARNISNQDIGVLFTYGTGFYMGANVVNGATTTTNLWCYYFVIKHNTSYCTVFGIPFGQRKVRTAEWHNNVWSGWDDMLKGSFDGTTLNIKL